MAIQIDVDRSRLQAFCRKWRVTEFAVFGSVLREDFHAASDVDVLLTFADGTNHSLLDLSAMQRELTELFGRDVDVLTRRGVEESRNPHRRQAILSSVEVIHAA